jgi:hypothetical protein
MLVYRIEGENGTGPYRGNPIPRMSWAHTDTSHPTPLSEGLCLDDDFFCGFRTLDQLKVWFKGFRNELRVTGFRLKVYEIPQRSKT